MGLDITCANLRNGEALEAVSGEKLVIQFIICVYDKELPIIPNSPMMMSLIKFVLHTFYFQSSLDFYIVLLSCCFISIIFFLSAVIILWFYLFLLINSTIR